MCRLSLLFVVAAVARAGDGRPDRHPWTAATETATKRYVVETNTFPEIADDLAAALDEAYVFFEDRFGPLEGKARRPMRIALFRTMEEYLGTGGGVAGAVGHFDGALDRCALVWDGGLGEAGWPVAVHEACHHYLRRLHPDLRLPSWYGEGVACWFEGVADPTAPGSVARMRIGSAKAALAAGDADLERVLLTQAVVVDGRLQLANFPPARFYGLSWSLVHFLATDPAARVAFRRFEMRLLAAQGSGFTEVRARRILEEECGDLADLEHRWHAHIDGLERPPEPVAAPVYAWDLALPRPYARYAALRRLGAGAIPADLRPALVQRLLDGDVVVRAAACEAIARAMDADAVPALEAALALGDGPVRRAALGALAHPSAAAAVPALLAEARKRGSGGDDRDAVLRALATIGDPRAHAALREALPDDGLAPPTRARCAAALAEDPEAVSALRVAAGDPQPAVRASARVALHKLENAIAEGALGAPAAPAPIPAPVATAPATPPVAPPVLPRHEVNRLLGLLRTPTAEDAVRARACRALARAGVREAVPLLRRLCGPGHPERVRLGAIRALVDLTGETRGFEPAQGPRAREAAYRAWHESP